MSDTKTPPPLSWKGPIAASVRTRLTDHKQCHSCGKVIKKGDEWGAIGDCPAGGKPSIVFLRLCAPCWDKATVGVKELQRGWEDPE